MNTSQTNECRKVIAYLSEKIELRVSIYEDKLRQVDGRYLSKVAKLAKGDLKREEFVQLLTQLVQPARIASALATIRFRLKTGKIVEADQDLERLERELLYVEQNLKHPILRKGLKFSGEHGRRRDVLTRAIDEALAQLGRNAKTDPVLDHIQTAPGIQEIDPDKTIVWRDARGKERTTTFKAFQNRVSERRRILFHSSKKFSRPPIPVSG
jgi:hypothetical protein